MKTTRTAGWLVCALSLLSSSLAIPQDSVVEQVRSICEAPSAERSSYFEVERRGGANGSVRVKFVGVLGAEGGVTLTEKEWEGVQRVLQGDQASDNQSYRRCARELTPILLRSKEDTGKNSENLPSYEELMGRVLESIPRNKFTYELIDGCAPVGSPFAYVRFGASTTMKRCEFELQFDVKVIESGLILRSPIHVSMENLIAARSCKTGRYVLELHGSIINFRNSDEGYVGVKFESERVRDAAYDAISELILYCNRDDV